MTLPQMVRVVFMYPGEVFDMQKSDMKPQLICILAISNGASLDRLVSLRCCFLRYFLNVYGRITPLSGCLYPQLLSKTLFLQGRRRENFCRKVPGDFSEIFDRVEIPRMVFYGENFHATPTTVGRQRQRHPENANQIQKWPPVTVSSSPNCLVGFE
jgi:hypothetical protein